MDTWSVVRAATGDWERVRRIRLRALADAPDAFGTTLAEDEARPPESWRARLADPSGATFLAVCGDRDVGLVVGAPFEGRDAAGLFAMWVDPAWRGRGVGGALVDAVVAWAREGAHRRVLLEVADGNGAAVRLYASRGFLPTGATGSLPPPRTHVREHERAKELGPAGAREGGVPRAGGLLAAAQTVPVPGDVAANVERHLLLAGAAAREGAGVVLFPELSLTGYEIDRARDLAFTADDSRLAPLREAAAARSTTLVVGAPFRDGERLHIGAFLLAPEGTVDVYTKRHLGAFPESARADGDVPPAEATVFRPGDRDPLLRVDGRTAALAICADAGHPSHPRAAAARGAAIYLAGMFVIPSEWARESASLSAIAARHSMAVVFANFGGPSGGLASAGRSTVWSATGIPEASLGPRGAGLVVAPADGSGGSGRAIPL